MKHELYNNSFDSKCRLAINGLALEVLVNDSDEYIRYIVASRGYGLNQLVNDPSTLVRIEVAYQGYGLDKLSKDSDPLVREAVVKKCHDPSKFVNDESSLVRMQVALRGRELEKLYNDENSLVREIVKSVNKNIPYILDYRGYITRIRYSGDDNILFGKIEGIKDLVNFESKNTEGIVEEFHKAVDDYLSIIDK